MDDLTFTEAGNGEAVHTDITHRRPPSRSSASSASSSTRWRCHRARAAERAMSGAASRRAASPPAHRGAAIDVNDGADTANEGCGSPPRGAWRRRTRSCGSLTKKILGDDGGGGWGRSRTRRWKRFNADLESRSSRVLKRLDATHLGLLNRHGAERLLTARALVLIHAGSRTADANVWLLRRSVPVPRSWGRCRSVRRGDAHPSGRRWRAVFEAACVPSEVRDVVPYSVRGGPRCGRALPRSSSAPLAATAAARLIGVICIRLRGGEDAGRAGGARRR